MQPWVSPFYTLRRPSGHVIAFDVQRARLMLLSIIDYQNTVYIMHTVYNNNYIVYFK